MYGRKKYLYIKWLIIQKYVRNLKQDGINKKKIKLKKISHITSRKLVIKNTNRNKLNILNNSEIKLRDPNFRFRVRRVRKRRVKSRKYKTWIFYSMLRLKNRNRVNKPSNFKDISLPVIKSRGYSLFFFRKKRKKLFKKKISRYIIGSLKYKLRFMLISTLYPSFRSLFKSYIKPLPKVKPRNRRKFNLLRKSGVYYLLRWTKGRYFGLFLQLLNTYNTTSLKRKKFIVKIKNLYDENGESGGSVHKLGFIGMVSYKKIKNIKNKNMGIFKFRINYQNINTKVIRKKKKYF